MKKHLVTSFFTLLILTLFAYPNIGSAGMYFPPCSNVRNTCAGLPFNIPDPIYPRPVNPNPLYPRLYDRYPFDYGLNLGIPGNLYDYYLLRSLLNRRG